MRIVFVVAALFALQGCKSAEERADEAASHAAAEKTQDDYIKSYADNIRNGIITDTRYICIYINHFKDGSQEFDKCFGDVSKMKVAQFKREADERSRRGLEQIANSLATYDASHGAIRCSTYGQTTNCNW